MRTFGTWNATLRAAGGRTLAEGETRLGLERRQKIATLLRDPTLSAAEIARRLGISRATVNHHRQTLHASGKLPAVDLQMSRASIDPTQLSAFTAELRSFGERADRLRSSPQRMGRRP